MNRKEREEWIKIAKDQYLEGTIPDSEAKYKKISLTRSIAASLILISDSLESTL